MKTNIKYGGLRGLGLPCQPCMLWRRASARIKAGKSRQHSVLHVLTSFTTVKFVFYTVLLPNGVVYTGSPAFNCTLVQWVRGLGMTKHGTRPSSTRGGASLPSSKGVQSLPTGLLAVPAGLL